MKQLTIQGFREFLESCDEETWFTSSHPCECPIAVYLNYVDPLHRYSIGVKGWGFVEGDDIDAGPDLGDLPLWVASFIEEFDSTVLFQGDVGQALYVLDKIEGKVV